MKTTAETYYVKDEKTGWWGYFTINEALGLLQIHSDFGAFVHRWDSAGQDFKGFLIGSGRDYVWHKVNWWALFTEHVTTKKANANLSERLDRMMEHLWPLFIGALRKERESVVLVCSEELTCSENLIIGGDGDDGQAQEPL